MHRFDTVIGKYDLKVRVVYEMQEFGPHIDKVFLHDPEAPASVHDIKDILSYDVLADLNKYIKFRCGNVEESEYTLTARGVSTRITQSHGMWLFEKQEGEPCTTYPKFQFSLESAIDEYLEE